jgi:putative transposase
VELNWSRDDRIKFIDSEGDIPKSIQAELLSINRTSLYYKPKAPSEEFLAIRNKIDELYTKWPYLGSRRITAMLNKLAIHISRGAVQHHMRDIGISGICPGPNLSKRGYEHKIYPYLLRNLTASRPNHIFGVDITYIRMKGSWMYLVAYLDWYSRYVVSWEINQTLEIGFVIEALKRALGVAIPDIVNSDQGSHFTSPKHTEILLENKVKISMDGRGRALDNIFTERLWRSVKYENIYINDYGSPKELRAGLTKYFHDKNNIIPHQALDYKTPAEVYYGCSNGHRMVI